jgi:DNA repair exonuclease SbcCD ATPase subunit
MRLLKLIIKNFKGIKELVIDANGKNVNIYGDNATGKTTIADAFAWLLNGKDSLNRSDFGIKPIDPETQGPIHGIETQVEAILDVGTSTLTLKKVFYENWVKERGAAEKTFKGNTTDYFIDDVPVKKGEYEKRIQEIADEKAFKLLTNPLYFNEQLHWTDRRKMLLQVCGDISTDEVIECNSKLAGLKEILGKHDVEQHKKMIASQKAEINKELEKIPARITEVKNMMPDTTGIVVSVVRSEIDGLLKQQDELRQESIRITSGGEIAEQNKKLAEINAELIGMKAVHSQKQSQALGNLLLDKTKIEGECGSLRTAYLMKQDEITSCDRQIKSLETEIESLYQQYDSTEAEAYCHRAFEFTQDSVCPTCGQAIPQEQLEAVREAAIQAYEEEKQKAIERFNLDKSNRLEKITSTGKETRSILDQKQEQKTKLEAELADLKQKGVQAKTQLEVIQKQIDTVQNSFVDVAETPEYKAKAEEVAKVKVVIAELHNGNTSKVAEIQGNIVDITSKIRDLESKINSVEQGKKLSARIDELKADEKRLAKEYERLEGELFIMEEFIRAKVKMLDSKINSRFKYVRFKLFDTQINGALNECCEALINTNGCRTPYSDANAAGKINGGIDIINTLSEFYSFDAPIFIDNAESVVDLAETKAQAFRLVVSGQDKALRIETEAA